MTTLNDVLVANTFPDDKIRKIKRLAQVAQCDNVTQFADMIIEGLFFRKWENYPQEWNSETSCKQAFSDLSTACDTPAFAQALGEKCKELKSACLKMHSWIRENKQGLID